MKYNCMHIKFSDINNFDVYDEGYTMSRFHEGTAMKGVKYASRAKQIFV